MMSKYILASVIAINEAGLRRKAFQNLGAQKEKTLSPIMVKRGCTGGLKDGNARGKILWKWNSEPCMVNKK